MFVDFVLSEAGQKLWMLKADTPDGPRKYDLLRMSVLPKVYEKYADVSTIKMNPFKFKSSFTHDAIKGSDRRVLVADLMKSTMIEPQSYLQACWAAALKSSKRDEILAEMTRPPIDEDAALTLARKGWDDVRTSMTTSWGNAARDKYLRLKAKAEANPR